MEKITAFDMKTSVAESVINLFDTMFSMKVELYVTDSETGLDGFRMTGSLSLAGDVMGTMAIQVSDVFARLMTAAMMGIELEEIESEEEVKDVIREACNIVGGSLKSALSDLGLSSEISIPSITTGNDFVIETLNMERYEFFTFHYQDHKFFVEVCIKAAANIDSEAQRQLTGIDIHKFKRLDIISTSGDSVIEFFKTMLDLDLELSEKASKSDSDDLQIMGLINFAGSVTGSLNIQTSYDLARIMTVKMLGIKLEEIESEEDVKDLVGEATNIIAGNLKAGFCDSGLNTVISVPSITTGNNFAIEILNMDRYERFVFRCMEYDIFLEVCVKIDESTNIPSQTESDAGDAVDSQEDIDNLLQSMQDSADDNVAEVLDKPGTIKDSVDEKAPPEINDQTKTINDAVDNKGSAGVDEIDSRLGFILDIPLEVTIELGRTEMKIDDLLRVGQGSVIKLEEFEGETLRILANSKLIAKGEVVVDKGKYGIRITEIVSRQKRIESMK